MRPLALITGASRGIGRAIARALAPTHTLLLSGRDEAALAALVAELALSEPQEPAHALTCELADPVDRARFLAEVAALCEQLGAPVQVLVNNAGAASSAPLHRTTDLAWAQALGLNLEAPFALTRALVPDMVRAGRGRVINIASTAALKGYAYTAAYSASKAGLVGLTRALAVELASKGVTVNAVCPGFTDTDIVARAAENIQAKTGRSQDDARQTLAAFSPQGRLRSPEEVAALVAYLASPAADGITGQALAIDGGETA
jgi:NAD(P)-dependent dehydrogenase (short-subunit alcohol dehydrogenase family)